MRNTDYDICKALRHHAYDNNPSYDRSKDLLQYPSSVGRLHLRCIHCGTVRSTEFDEYGQWTSNHHYIRPVDYKQDGEVKMSTASMRLLWLGRKLPSDAV